jgi:hypothetical protein
METARPLGHARAMRDLPLASMLARRVAPLLLVAAFAAACAPSVAPMSAPSSNTPAPASPVGATPGTRAAGTVKIHDGNSESEGPANDPKVCTFHLHFFFGAGTSGAWRIATQPGGSQVMNGSWSSGEAGDVRVPEAPDLFSLADGQYKLYWTQVGEKGEKQKVFKVECATPTGTPEPTPVPTATPSPAPTAIPSAAPTAVPSEAPTAAPTTTPSPTPTATPTAIPSAAPTAVPSDAPTAAPTAMPDETLAPTPAPTAVPTPAPTAAPTATLTPRPTGGPGGTTKPEATASPRPSGDVGSETGGTNTPQPGGGTAPDTAMQSPAMAGTDRNDATGALLALLIAGLAGLLVAQRRFAAER